jgi:DNA-binding PadR family transcriptional regulator
MSNIDMYLEEIYMMDLRFVIMKMLSKQTMNGYSLKKNLSNILGKDVSSGALYPALKQLETDNLIIIKDAVLSGRYQKLYSLTDKGALNLKGDEAVIRKLMDIDRSSVKLEIFEGVDEE